MDNNAAKTPNTQAASNYVAYLFKLGRRPYLVTVLFYLLMMFSVFLIGQFQYKKSLQLLADENIETVVSFVARTIQALNQNAWAQEESAVFVIPPFGGQDKIQSVMITNALGGIIYPQDKAYDILENETLEEVLKEGAREIFAADSPVLGTLYHPVFAGETLKGAIIVKFQRVATIPGSNGAFVSKAQLLLLAIGLGGAIFLVWLFLLPWRTLITVVEECIESGSDIEFDGGQYNEINNMTKLIRTIFLRHQ